MIRIRLPLAIPFVVVTLLAAPLAAQDDARLVFDELMTRGANELKKQQYDDAIGTLSKAIRLHDRSPRAYRLRGIAYLGKERHESAIVDFDNAIVLDRNEPTAYSYRGRAKLALGDTNGAIDDLSAAIALNPRFAPAYYHRARAKVSADQLRGAILDFAETVKLDPKHLDGWIEMGAAKAQIGQFAAAARDQSKAIELDPTADVAWYNRGRALFARGDFEGAERDFTVLIRLLPRDATAYLMRAAARMRLGDLLGAAGDFEVTIELDPKRVAAFTGRADIRAAVGDVEGALDDYGRAVQLAPNTASIRFQRGLFHITRREWDAALKDMRLFSEMTAATPYSAYGQLWVWLARSHGGDAAQASAELRAYLVNHKDTIDPWFAKLADHLLGRLNEANLLLAAAANGAGGGEAKAAADHRKRQAWFFAGAVAELKGDHADAVRLYRKCVADGAEQVEAQAAFGQLRQVLLGMRVRGVDEARREKLKLEPGVGFIIDRVTDAGPAHAAGIRADDALIRIGDRDATAAELHRLALEARPGDAIKLVIVRNGIRRIEVKIAAWKR